MTRRRRRWYAHSHRSALAARNFEAEGYARPVDEGDRAIHRAPQMVRSRSKALDGISPPLRRGTTRAFGPRRRAKVLGPRGHESRSSMRLTTRSHNDSVVLRDVFLGRGRKRRAPTRCGRKHCTWMMRAPRGSIFQGRAPHADIAPLAQPANALPLIVAGAAFVDGTAAGALRDLLAVLPDERARLACASTPRDRPQARYGQAKHA